METVLRELEFNQWVLRINLKDLGGFWIKNYLHTSPTLAFQPEERDKIENIVEKIDQSPHLKKLKRRVVGNKYPVLQIDVPIRQMGPRHYSLTQLKDHFVWAKLDDDKEKKLQQLGEAFEKSQDLGKAFGNFFANIRFALPFLIEREDKWKVIASKSLEYIRSNILPHIEKLEIDKEPIKTRLSKIYKQSKNEKLKEFFEALEAIFS